MVLGWTKGIAVSEAKNQHFVPRSYLKYFTHDGIQTKANIDARNEKGRTALHELALAGSLQEVQVLVDYGANIRHVQLFLDDKQGNSRYYVNKLLISEVQARILRGIS